MSFIAPSVGPILRDAGHDLRNGKQLDADCCLVFEVKDGRITSGRECFYDLNNWDTFWS